MTENLKKWVQGNYEYLVHGDNGSWYSRIRRWVRWGAKAAVATGGVSAGAAAVLTKLAGWW